MKALAEFLVAFFALCVPAFSMENAYYVSVREVETGISDEYKCDNFDKICVGEFILNNNIIKINFINDGGSVYMKFLVGPTILSVGSENFVRIPLGTTGEGETVVSLREPEDLLNRFHNNPTNPAVIVVPEKEIAQLKITVRQH